MQGLEASDLACIWREHLVETTHEAYPKAPSEVSNAEVSNAEISNAEISNAEISHGISRGVPADAPRYGFFKEIRALQRCRVEEAEISSGFQARNHRPVKHRKKSISSCREINPRTVVSVDKGRCLT